MDGGFKHIKVTPAQEQEVVIHAGARTSHDEQRPSAAQEEPAASMRKRKETQEALSASRRAKMRDAGYEATTLEDIESSRMPKVQVAIIVVAVCAIIAFVVWYAFFS